MTISRDEAREIAIIGLLAATALRIGAGVLQAIEEIGGAWTIRSMLSRFFAPVGSTLGLLVLGAVLVAALSPEGSVNREMTRLCRIAASLVALLGVSATLYTLAWSYSPPLARMWFAMINGLSAATLGGTAYWIASRLDPHR